MTDKPRFSITLDEPLFARLERYRYECRFSTRSKAAVHLIEVALNELSHSETLTADEKIILEGYKVADLGVRHIMEQAAKVALLEKKDDPGRLSSSGETA